MVLNYITFIFIIAYYHRSRNYNRRSTNKIKNVNIIMKEALHVYLHVSLYSTKLLYVFRRGRLGRDRMVVVFTSTYAISAYHH